MNPLVKTLGLITGCASVSYLTLTAMMQDPDKPYRGHLYIIKSNISQSPYLSLSTSRSPMSGAVGAASCGGVQPQSTRTIFTL